MSTPYRSQSLPASPPFVGQRLPRNNIPSHGQLARATGTIYPEQHPALATEPLKLTSSCSSRAPTPLLDDPDPDVHDTIGMNRHTEESAVEEFESYMKLHWEKPKLNSVSREPTETQCMLPLTIDESMQIIERNISNRREGRPRDNRLPTTQTGPMTTEVRLIARRCEFLEAAKMDLPISVVGMGFQNIGGVLDTIARDRDVHSHHQTRDKAVDFWWSPVGYVWMYGSYLHSPDTVRTMLRELDRDSFRREFLNSKGQTERIVASSPYQAGAFIIYELDLKTLLDAFRQVPPATEAHETVPPASHLIHDLQQNPSHDADPRRRHVIRYAYSKYTLARLDTLRPFAPLIERFRDRDGASVFTTEEIATLEHFQLTRRYRAMAIDGPPRTLPYGAYVIRQFSSIAFDREMVRKYQQSDSAAIHATVKRTNTGGSTPGSRMDPEKQARYDSIVTLSRPVPASRSPPSRRRTYPSRINDSDSSH